MSVTILPSPNCNDRPDGEPVSLLIMHYTGMPTAGDALARLCNPNAEVSSHYVVTEEGEIIQLVEEQKRAWHAGKSHWRGRDNLNDISIGIEIVNPGHEFGYRPFPPRQMEAVLELSLGILARHPAIMPRNVIGHSDIAPDRKEDPGELFPWGWLADHGVGIWPHAGLPLQENKDFLPIRGGDSGEHVTPILQGLAAYGYPVMQFESIEEYEEKLFVAFRRHFVQENLSPIWDAACQQALDFLLKIS